MLLVMVLSFLILLFIGVPVAFSMAMSSFIYIFISSITGGSLTFNVAVQRIVLGIDSFPLMAVPFFVLAGEFMNVGGVTKRIIDLAKALVGHIKGGIAQVNILASVIFAAMSGSSIACASIYGRMLIPIMKEEGYDSGFSSVCISCAATIGPIIPPSIIMIIYGVMANASVGRLFIGGIIPGLIMGGGLMIVAYYVARKKCYPVYEKAGFKVRFQEMRRAFFPLLMPIILIGGIVTGIFTPTEAAIVAAVYGLFLGLIQGEIKFSHLRTIAFNTAIGSARIMFITAAAALFGWILTLERAPQFISSFLLSISDSRFVTLLIINLVLLIIGMFMEGTAIIIMTTPIFMPVVQILGIDPIHFGIMMMVNIMIGTVTPPVGVLMYVTNNIAGIGIREYIKFAKPFYLVLLFSLFLISYVPILVTFLPNLMMG